MFGGAATGGKRFSALLREGRLRLVRKGDHQQMIIGLDDQRHLLEPFLELLLIAELELNQVRDQAAKGGVSAIGGAAPAEHVLTQVENQDPAQVQIVGCGAAVVHDHDQTAYHRVFILDGPHDGAPPGLRGQVFDIAQLVGAGTMLAGMAGGFLDRFKGQIAVLLQFSRQRIPEPRLIAGGQHLVAGVEHDQRGLHSGVGAVQDLLEALVGEHSLLEGAVPVQEFMNVKLHLVIQAQQIQIGLDQGDLLRAWQGIQVGRAAGTQEDVGLVRHQLPRDGIRNGD